MARSRKAYRYETETITLVGGSMDGQKLRMMEPCPPKIVLGMGSEVYVRNGATTEYRCVGNTLPPEVIHTETCDLDEDCSCRFTSWLRTQTM